LYEGNLRSSLLFYCLSKILIISPEKFTQKLKNECFNPNLFDIVPYKNTAEGQYVYQGGN